MFGKTSGSRVIKTLQVAAALLLAVACCTVSVPVPSYAAPSDDLQAQADEARAKLEEMSAQLSQASDDYYTALEEHDEAVAKMEEEQQKIDELAAKIEESQESLKSRAVSMYRSDQVSLLDVLLGSASFKDFATTWDFLVSWNEDTSSMIAENKALKEESEAALAEYEAQEQLAAEKLAEAEAVQAEAQSLVDQYQAEVDSLDAEVAELIAQEEAAEEAAAQAQWQASSSSQSSSSGSPSSSSGGYSSVVEAAYSRLGCPYVWAATGPDSFDCSGLTQWCYAQAGISIPRTSSAQYAAGTKISLSEAQPGDVLWMSGHVGIYIGNGAYIHAPSSGDVVKISYNMSMWTCALRF